MVESIKAELPDIHIHGFTPLEVWQGAETLGVPVRQFLTRLRDAGWRWDAPGTAARRSTIVSATIYARTR